MRRLLPIAVGIVLVVAVVVGLSQAGGGTTSAAKTKPYDLQAGLQRLQGAPAPLAGLHAQAADLLGGGESAFRARLAALRGTPVVVNVWASWCGPCRHEFPFFQQVATARGKDVAFLGVDTRDHRGPGTAYLRDTPVPYPSYLDGTAQPIVRALKQPPRLVPLTIFVDRDGKTAFTKAGGYADRAELETDIDRYLG